MLGELSDELREAVTEALGQALGGVWRITDARPVSGGCISRNYRIGTGREVFFLKVAPGSKDMFAAEVDGLAALARCDTLVVPRAVYRGSSGKQDFLVLGWLDLVPHGDEAKLGEAVAALHEISFSAFGWHQDNFIGATPQPNGWYDDWPRFFAERRLIPQLEMAATRGARELAKAAQPLVSALPDFFMAYRPTPVLLHGDLWIGNVGFVAGRPALFDPAIHAGDREADLAMTELFGGFGPRFYSAYDGVRRQAPGYGVRRRIYQLYHVLNHYNLFGSGYRGQAAALIREILTALSKRTGTC